MTTYHVYVHYRDKKGKAIRAMEYNYKKKAVEQQIATLHGKQAISHDRKGDSPL